MTSSSSHCWVCDHNGVVYFLTDINATSVVSTKLEWIRVDSGFKSVCAGSSGMVCGIKDSILHYRRGITCQNPLGSEWDRYMCDVINIMIGRTCIVRNSSKGTLHFTKVLGHPAPVLDWIFVPQPQEDCRYEKESLHCRYVVDENDRLYYIARDGEVFCCELLSSNLDWNLITGPPQTNKGWISSIMFWRSVDDWVNRISSGLESIWCLKEDSSDLWQLVINSLNKKIKSNWIHKQLPLSSEEKIVSLSACRSAKNRLYVITKEKSVYKLILFSFVAGNESKVYIPLPASGPYLSLTISYTTNITRSTSREEVNNRPCTSQPNLKRKRTTTTPIYNSKRKKTSLIDKSFLDMVQFSQSESLLIDGVSSYDTQQHYM